MRRFQNHCPDRIETETAACKISDWLCGNWGFCDAGQQRELSEFVGKTPGEFAEFVPTVEGMETDPLVSEWRKKMGDKVEELMRKWEGSV